MDLIKIGKFIQSKRKELNLTQSDLAEKLGITDRAISKWENGVCLPDASNIFELCNILKISVNDLFNGEETMENNDKRTERMLVEMLEQKQIAEKRLLAMEVVIGLLVSVVLFACVLFAGLIELPTWFRIGMIVFGFVIFIVGCFCALRIEQTAGYYECAKCHHKHIPGFAAMLFAMHMGRTRYMKCPHCNERSWQKKVLSSREDVENVEEEK